MDDPLHPSCTAFQGSRKIASGDLRTVALAVKAAMDSGAEGLLVFDDQTGRPIDLDLRGDRGEILARLPEPLAAEPARRGPGRPKLGVTAKEVTLLPRHWEWLRAQPGGASVALRKLVEEARKAENGKGGRRGAQDAAYRFMSAMAGDEPGFEEAIRALFAADRVRFMGLVKAWPADVRDHARKLANDAFAPD